MAAGLNRISVIGNLGRDPEVRATQSGTSVCNLSVAVTERRKEGETWKDHTEWFNVIVFGKTAENAGRYLKKGRQIYAEGRLQTRQWDDKEGQKRTTVEIVANQLLFLGGGREDDGAGHSSASTERPGTPPSADFIDDDDIPF